MGVQQKLFLICHSIVIGKNGLPRRLGEGANKKRGLDLFGSEDRDDCQVAGVRKKLSRSGFEGGKKKVGLQL